MNGRGLTNRQLPLRFMLLALVVPLLLVTVFTVVAVGQWNSRDSVMTLARALGTEVAHGASAKIYALLEPAESVLLQCRQEARRGLLPVDDPAALAERLVERFRYEHNLAWLSYGDEAGRFTGVWRDKDGAIVLNRSWPAGVSGGASGGAGVRMVEEIVHADGSRTFLRDSDDWGYDPRQRPFYQKAVAAEGLAWTPPYAWWDSKGLGLTASLALRDEQGRMRGAFTADFHLEDLSNFLAELRLGHSGTVHVLTREGQVIAGPDGRLVGEPATMDQRLAGALAELRSSNVDTRALKADEPQTFVFKRAGVYYAAVYEVIPVPGGVEWVALMVVPADEIFGFAERNAMWTLAIGAVATLAAIVISWVLAARLTRPLAAIAHDLARVAQFELSAGGVHRSHVREIAVVGQAAERMKASLRSFSHYVPTALVRDLLLDGQEARLGARPHTVTIHFSDVEDFTGITHRTSPPLLIEALGDYFELTTQVLARHQATLDKFIGDGVLAFYNAPAESTDHPAQACRAALALQARLAAAQATWSAAGRPVLLTRIVLHTAEVLVGNVGATSRFDYTIMGDGVNLASRLLDLSKIYGRSLILASQQTREAAGSEFEWRRIDCVIVRGRKQAGDIFELLGARGAVDATILRARDAYETGLAAYCAGRFEQALPHFGAALELRPDDRAAPTLMDRARAYRQQPPPPDWKGVYIDEAATPAEARTAAEPETSLGRPA